MKAKYFVPAVALAAVVSACSEDEWENLPTQVSGNDQIEATLGGSTRTELSGSENTDVVWSTGDQISVFQTKSDDTSSPYNQLYTLNSEAGKTSGTFSGSLVDGATKAAALYPYAEGATLTVSDDNVYTINTTIPSEITFSAMPTSGVLNGAPMVAQFNESGVAEFKNPGAVVDVTVENFPTGYNAIVLKSAATTDAANLNGAVTITTGTNATMTLAENNGGSTETVISWTGSNTGTVRAIFPVPVGKYALKVYLRGTDKTDLLALNLGTKNVARNTRYGRTITYESIFGTFARAAQNVTECNANLADVRDGLLVQTVSVKEVTSDTTIVLPANQSNGAGALYIQLGSVASNTALNLATGTGAGYVSKSVFIYANAASASSIKKLTVNSGTTTLSLLPGTKGGSVVYDELETTATEVRLYSGVTVKKLTIGTGTIVVLDGAKVEDAELAESTTSGLMYYDGTASDIVKKADAITVYPYDYLRIRVGGTVKLHQDITVPSGDIQLSRSLALDLNGHNITSTNGFIAIFGTVTTSITNTSSTTGTITGSRFGIYATYADLTIGSGVTIKDTKNSSYTDADHAALYIATAGNVTIDGATIEDETFAGVVIYPTNTTQASLTVNSGSITGYVYGITGNGTCKAAKSTTISISGGTVQNTRESATLAAPAIYHPQNGEMTISGNAVITSPSTGIEVRGGSVTISGGEVKTTASESGLVSGGNTSGTTMRGMAIAMSQHTTDLDTKVTISGTAKITAPITAGATAYALYEEDLQNNTGTKEIEISGGTITGKVDSKNCTKFITGGSFKGFGDSLSAFLADGYSLGDADTSTGYQTVSATTSGAPRKR